MGRAYRVVKRTAHLTVAVTERPEKMTAAGGAEVGREAAAAKAGREGA